MERKYTNVLFVLILLMVLQEINVVILVDFNAEDMVGVMMIELIMIGEEMKVHLVQDLMIGEVVVAVVLKDEVHMMM